MDLNPDTDTDADTDADADPATCPISNCKQTKMCKYFRIKRERAERIGKGKGQGKVEMES